MITYHDGGLDVQPLLDVPGYKYWNDVVDEAPVDLPLWVPERLAGFGFPGEQRRPAHMRPGDPRRESVDANKASKKSTAAAGSSEQAAEAEEAGVDPAELEVHYLLPKATADRVLRDAERVSRLMRRQMGLPIPIGLTGSIVYPEVQEGDTECPVCKSKCKDTKSLKRHMKIHTGEGKHHCSVCRRHFSTARALREHLPSHDEDSTGKLLCPHQCTNRFGAPVTFSNKRNLQVHLDQYHPSGPEVSAKFSCPYCGHGFKNKKSMMSHRTNCKSKPSAEKFVCVVEGCDKIYSRRRDMMHHVRQKHPEQL